MERSKGSWKSTLFLTLLWLNFVGLWAKVIYDTTAKDAAISIQQVGELMSVYGVLVALWIFHNIRIFRKKGPRRSVRTVPFVATVDTLQRVISRRGDLTGQEITIDVVGDQKVFCNHVDVPQEVVLTS